MTANPLQLIAFDKYGRLLHRMFPDANGVVVCDTQLDILWHSDRREQDLTRMQQGISATINGSWLTQSDSMQRLVDAAGQTLFRASLNGESGAIIGWLYVIYDTRSSVPLSSASPTLAESLQDVQTVLQEAIDLHLECDQIAAELSERYEELNVVYSTKDQIDRVSETKEALSVIVQNCAEYLDSQFAAIITNDRALVLTHTSGDDTLTDHDELTELLLGKIYDRVEAQQGSVIINENDHELRELLLDGRRENLLTYPISSDHGEVIGIIAAVAKIAHRTFSNSDRNLLQNMARKASRIIRSHHDALTGLLNRNGFEPSMTAALASASNTSSRHCLFHIDIDQLHVINDLVGYAQGDQLIRRVSAVLRDAVRESDLVARLSGDEFAVLLNHCDIDHSVSVAEKILTGVRDLTVVTGNDHLNVTVSIGIAPVHSHEDGVIGIMAAAEVACKTAKEEGNDRIKVYDADNSVIAGRSAEIEWNGQVQSALRENRFELHSQLVRPLLDRKGAPHFEILLRMLDKQGKILSPAVFMPAAERYKLMPQIDRWVIHNALRQIAAAWHEIACHDAVFCINLSGQSLTSSGFLKFVQDELATSGLPTRNICFEITETAAIGSINEAIAFMSALRGIGCRFSLDDFGAGLSSFAYLKMLPVDYLKIDGCFVRELVSDNFSQTIVEAVCRIAQKMNMATVAEFVGDEATVTMLLGNGVNYVQGYFIGRPEPLRDTIERLIFAPQSASA